MADIDYSKVKLGLKAITKPEPMRMMAATQILRKLPPPPPLVDWGNGVTQWGAMLNDKLGICTCAGIGHNDQIVSMAATGKMDTPPDDVVLQLYKDAAGYNPNDPDTDRGAYEPEILKYVKQNGFHGHKLLGWVSPNPQDLNQIRQAIAHFGCVYMGAILPNSIMGQNIWDVDPHNKGTLGGHCMIAPFYDVYKRWFRFVTWGKNQLCTFDWWFEYVGECHVLLWDTWLKRYPGNTQQQVMDILKECA